MSNAIIKKHRLSVIAVSLLVLFASAAVQARKDDMDVDRLTNTLNQLAADPNLGTYAQADQALARDAINQLAQSSSHERPHALYIAQRRVEQAKAEAQLQASQRQLNQLDQENAQLQLERSRIDATAAQQQLDIQRMQYQLAQQETQRLQAQGQVAADQAAQARAEAEQARKLAAAQSKVAAAARRQAELAAKAAKALRAQMQDQSSPSSGSGGGK
jgi:membrane protein involved in colicin uptake